MIILLLFFYLVGAFAYYQIFCNVYVYRRKCGSYDWYKDKKDKNAIWFWILGFIGLCIPILGALVFFIIYCILATVGVEDDCLKYKIPENTIFKFLNKKV